MAKTTTENSTLTVPGKPGEKFPFSWEELSGSFDEALAHADGKDQALADAYFDAVNAKAKASARQKVYNANIDPVEKAKQDAIRNIAAALYDGDLDKARVKFAELSQETGNNKED